MCGWHKAFSSKGRSHPSFSLSFSGRSKGNLKPHTVSPISGVSRAFPTFITTQVTHYDCQGVRYRAVKPQYVKLLEYSVRGPSVGHAHERMCLPCGRCISYTYLTSLSAHRRLTTGLLRYGGGDIPVNSFVADNIISYSWPPPP